jgi:hypothetical protein
MTETVVTINLALDLDDKRLRSIVEETVRRQPVVVCSGDTAEEARTNADRAVALNLLRRFVALADEYCALRPTDRSAWIAQDREAWADARALIARLDGER